MKKISKIIKEAKTSPDQNFGIKKIIDFSTNEFLIKKEFVLIGKELIGKNFVVKEELAKTITNLLIYFTGNPGTFDLNKGIYIHGSFGTGKTTLFRIIRKLLTLISDRDQFGKKFNPNGFQITSIEQIIDTYKNDGSLDYFGYRTGSNPLNLCINEFGKNINEKIYGTNANELINSLFMIRYELFQKGYLTHCTSNFHPRDMNVEKIIADRMKEMFNFVEINGESFRI